MAVLKELGRRGDMSCGSEGGVDVNGTAAEEGSGRPQCFVASKRERERARTMRPPADVDNRSESEDSKGELYGR